MLPGRVYESSLREAQASQTRERILAAAVSFLEGHEMDSLTLHRLADLADISAPTVYAHFPTMEDLVKGLFAWLKPRLGIDRHPTSVSGLPDLPGRRFPLYEQYDVLRALMRSPSFHRARRADSGNRHSQWIEAAALDRPDLEPAGRRLAALAVSAFWTPTMWLLLVDECGLTPADGAKTASWATRALVAALLNDADVLAMSPLPAPRRRKRASNPERSMKR